MSIITKSFLLFIVIFFTLVQATEINDQILKIEKMASEKLNQANLSNKEKFYVFLLAGREFYNYRMFKKSEEYYLKAIDLKTTENHLEPLVNLIAIEMALKNKEQILFRTNALEKYLESNSQFKTIEVSDYLNMVKASSSGKGEEGIIPFYGNYIAKLELDNLIKEKNYIKALSLLNLENIKKSNNAIMQMNYDLLNVLNNKTEVKELQCSGTLKKYPNSASYSMMICDVLVSFLKTKKLDKNKLKKLDNYFHNADGDKNYYYSALLDLEKK